jgi:hypothetical protein
MLVSVEYLRFVRNYKRVKIFARGPYTWQKGGRKIFIGFRVHSITVKYFVGTISDIIPDKTIFYNL